MKISPCQLHSYKENKKAVLKDHRNKFPFLLIIYFFITCFSIGALFIATWFTKGSYFSLVDFVTETLKRPDLKPLIIKSLFTREKYEAIYKFHWLIYPLIAGFSIALFYYAREIYKNMLFAVCYVKSSLFHVFIFFKKLSQKEKIILGLGCLTYLFLILYNDHLKQVSYDEAWGYNYYINKPFYFPIILFNTYPLFNLVTHFFTFLPFNTIINLRLPSLLFGLLSLLALFYTLYKHAGFFLSVFALLILFSSPLFYIYSSLSRGITLSLFLFIVVIHVVIRLITGAPLNKRYRFLYIVSNILGVVSIPTFIVFTAANSLFLIISKWSKAKFRRTTLLMTAIIFLGSLTWYIPVLLNSGLSLIYHNHYTFNIVDSAKKLKSFMAGLSELFFVSEYIVLLLLLITPVLLLIKRQTQLKKTIVGYSLFAIAFTFLARAASGNIFPERSLNYLVVSFIIIAVWITSILWKRLSPTLKVGLAFSFLVLFSFSCVKNQKQLLAPAEDKDAKIIASLLLKNKVKDAYIDEEEFWYRVPMIQYYYSEEQKEINFTTSTINSTRYQPFNKNNNYDCIITKPSFSLNISLGYKEIYRNDSFVLWKRS